MVYQKSAENGWSRNVLVHQIESKLYQRQVLSDKITNFEHRLPSPQSELAVQTMKDPYVFDFIPFGKICLNETLNRLWFEMSQSFFWSLEQVLRCWEINIT